MPPTDLYIVGFSKSGQLTFAKTIDAGMLKPSFSALLNWYGFELFELADEGVLITLSKT